MTKLQGTGSGLAIARSLSSRDPRMDSCKRQLIESVFAGGGEMGALMRAFDWSTAPLGPVDRRPQSLRICVHIVLGLGCQTATLWGRGFVSLYNDADRPFSGAKHPWTLGRRSREVFPESWDFAEPLFNRVMTQAQAASFLTDQLRKDLLKDWRTRRNVS